MHRLVVLSTLYAVLPSFNTVLRANSGTVTMATLIKDIDFEVFGRVQGVFFRKYTKEQAMKLGLRGWCKNTYSGTVLGHLQGPPDKVDSMMNWLQTTGSPNSKIEKAEFKNAKEISEYTFDSFSINRD